MEAIRRRLYEGIIVLAPVLHHFIQQDSVPWVGAESCWNTQLCPVKRACFQGRIFSIEQRSGILSIHFDSLLVENDRSLASCGNLFPDHDWNGMVFLRNVAAFFINLSDQFPQSDRSGVLNTAQSPTVAVTQAQTKKKAGCLFFEAYS